MIALTIFSVFISAFIVSQGYNLSDSALLEEEIMLKELCNQKINEIILDPPRFRESLTLTPDKGTFENNKDYKYIVEYKQFKIPDISKIMGKDENEQNDQNENSAIQQTLMEKIKDNMEKILWQIRVKAVNKETDFSFELSTWLLNEKARIEFSDI